MIQLHNISKSFRDQNVLKSVDLTIQKGQTIYIKGANGSGKSTLLKIIAGLINPDGGSISGVSGLDVGALIENPSFIEERPLLDNLKFLYTLKQKYDYDAIKKYCDRLQLDITNPKPMRSYSIGMRQKAGIIQAIMERQSLILFDEPTRGLDKESVDVFIELIHQDLKDRTIIICAHEGIQNIQFDQHYELKNGILTTF